MCIVNTYLKYMNVPKYTNEVRGRDEKKVMSIIILVLVKRDVLK